MIEGLVRTLACMLVIGGCARQSAGTTEPESPSSAAAGAEEASPAAEPMALGPHADVVARLPPSPEFPQVDVPTRYDDGAWSIAGLREDLPARTAEGDRGTDILVRAYVQEIYVPPECPAGDTCPPLKQPHLWLVDDPDIEGKHHALLVANYRFLIPEWDAAQWEDQPAVTLEVGQRYTFEGRLRFFSDTGFASDRGVLEFRAYEAAAPDGTTRWVIPRGAPWHPLVIEEQERANRELADRAKESALEQQQRRPRK